MSKDLLQNTLKKIEKYQIPVDWIEYGIHAFGTQVRGDICSLLFDDLTCEYGKKYEKKSPVSEMLRVRSYIDDKNQLINVLTAHFRNYTYVGPQFVTDVFHPEIYYHMKRILQPLQIPFEQIENTSSSQ